jgi:hypothetical protein
MAVAAAATSVHDKDMLPRRAGWLAAILISCAFVIACGSDDGLGGADGGSMTCLVESIAEAHGAGGQVTAVGTIRCSREAALDLSTCVQRYEDDAFEDLECDEAARANATALDVALAVPCEPGDGHRYRATTRAHVDDTEAPEHISEEVTCE